MINKFLNYSIFLSLLNVNDKILTEITKQAIKDIELNNNDSEETINKYFEIYTLNLLYQLFKEGIISLNFSNIDLTKVLNLFVNYSVYEEMLLLD